MAVFAIAMLFIIPFALMTAIAIVSGGYALEGGKLAICVFAVSLVLLVAMSIRACSYFSG